MNYEKIIEFVTQNPVCTIATYGERPHNRAFLSNIIDNKIYFTTSTNKNVGQEILKNPKIELCYLKNDFTKMLRIESEVSIIDGRKLKQKLINERDYLKSFSADDEIFLLFTLKNSKAFFWSIENNMRENELEKILF